MFLYFGANWRSVCTFFPFFALPYDMMSFNENEIHHGIFKTSLARPKKLIFVILLASECRLQSSLHSSKERETQCNDKGASPIGDLNPLSDMGLLIHSLVWGS